MKWFDYLAEKLHDYIKLHDLLCFCGLHYWSYRGEAFDWIFGVRHVWVCSKCHAEKWLREEFE